MGLTTFAVPLTDEQAEHMRTLTAEMVEKYLDGLAERARWIGYDREGMYLQKVDDRWLLLVTLGFKGDDPSIIAKGVRAYPGNEFTRWWNPQFQPLLGEQRAANEVLFVWEDDVAPAEAVGSGV